MTSKRSLRIKTRILSVFVLSLAALTVLIAVAAPIPQAGAAQPSAEPLAANVRVAERTVVSRAQAKLQHDRALAPDNSLSFLPAVNYDSRGWVPASGAIADVNRDRKPDVVVANYCYRPWPTGGHRPRTRPLGNADRNVQPASAFDH